MHDVTGAVIIDFKGLPLYHRAAMSTGLPLRIQVLKGQGGERNYSGTLNLAQMPRLADCVVGTKVSIQLDLLLNRDRRGRCQATPTIDVTLQLQCQRCMKAMDWSASLTNQLELLIDDEQEASNEQVDTFVLDEGFLDVPALVEDEILLALPIAPLHDADSDCGRDGLNRQTQRDDRENPFAALAALKSQH
jgi:uncharacterized protein